MTEDYLADAVLAELRANFKDGPACPKHAEIVEKLRERIMFRATQFGADKEIKKFEVTSSGPLTFMVIEVGLVGDEGTMASVFCRDYRHIAIAKRGGLSLLNCKNQRKKHGWFNAVHALTK